MSKRSRFSSTEQARLVARGFKRCPDNGCGQVLPLEDFYRNSARSDNHDQYCKTCRKAIQAELNSGKKLKLKLNSMAGRVNRG